MSGASLVKSISVPSMTFDFWRPYHANNPVIVPAKRKITLPVKRSVKPAVTVRQVSNNPKELKSLMKHLCQIDFAATFAIRNLLRNILTNQLPNSQVSILESGDIDLSIDNNSNWTDQSIDLSTNHTRKLKSICIIYKVDNKDDIDNAAVWAFDRDSASDHLRHLAVSRRWHSRGVVIVNIKEDLLGALEDVFPDTELCYVSPQPASRLYISEPYTERELEQRFVESSMSMPANLKFDRLNLDDALIVAANWDFERPNKIEYVRWLIKHFTGVCVRDMTKNDQPISWGLINEFNAKGFKFVAPEYRRHGLSVSNMYALLLAYMQPKFLCNTQDFISKSIIDQNDQIDNQVFYALVADENEASIRGNAKAGFKPTQVRCTRFVYSKRNLIG